MAKKITKPKARVPRKRESRLDLTAVEMAKATDAVAKNLIAFLEGIPERAPAGEAHDPEGNAVRADLKRSYRPSRGAPEKPEKLERLVSLLFRELAPLSHLPGHPGYWAYLSGGGNFLSALAQFISQGINPFTAHDMMAPGFTEIEKEVIGWFRTLMGFPDSAAGFLTSGSSLASLSAITAARRAKLPTNFLNGTLYISDQAHHCIAKAASLAGFPPNAVRVIPTERPGFRMDGHLLRETIAKDRRAGFTPFFVVGTAGTTNTGAIDDLASLSRFCAQEKLWFHVDGAYGALFMMTPEGKKKLAGLSAADSLAFDPHKAMNVPYGTGCLLVRDPRWLRVAHSVSASYMPPETDGSNPRRMDFSDLSPELSRDFRGLKLWLPLKVWGIGPFRKNLVDKLKWTRWLAAELAREPNLQVMAEPELTVLGFAIRVGTDPAVNNRATRELLVRLNSGRRFFFSTCTLDGRLVIRVCLLAHRTTGEDVRRGARAIADAARDIAKAGRTEVPRAA